MPAYSSGSTVTRNITVFNDDFSNTSVAFAWTAYLNQAGGTVIASGTSTLTIPLGSRVTQPVTFTAPATGSRIYLVLSTSKSGTTTFSDSAEYFTLGSSSGPTPGTYHIVNRNSGKPLAIAGNSTADGAKAVQQSGGLPWTISTAPGGTFTLAYTGSGKVLDVNGGSSTAGLQLQQWTANGGTNQQWYLKPTGDRVLHHRQPRQRTSCGRVRPVNQRRSPSRAMDRQRRHQPAMAVGALNEDSQGGRPAVCVWPPTRRSSSRRADGHGNTPSPCAFRGTIAGRRRPLCVRGRQVPGPCGPRTGTDQPTDGDGKSHGRGRQERSG